MKLSLDVFSHSSVSRCLRTGSSCCCYFWDFYPDPQPQPPTNERENEMSKICVASSWRNDYQPSVVKTLREAGHEVYDFRNPHEGYGFHWSGIDPDWKSWTPAKYRDCLKHPMAEKGFNLDIEAMNWADTFVGVQPFGRSASIEMG